MFVGGWRNLSLLWSEIIIMTQAINMLLLRSKINLLSSG